MNDMQFEREGALERRERVRMWDRLIDLYEGIESTLAGDLRLIRTHFDLFLGVCLFLIGILNFSSGKYCDGNTADYLSCTRPMTYYYYGWMAIAAAVIGAFFILAWLLKRSRGNS